jgi:hypothetical protein
MLTPIRIWAISDARQSASVKGKPSTRSANGVVRLAAAVLNVATIPSPMNFSISPP